MRLVKAYSAAINGIHAKKITIEVSVAPGIRYHIVGLPDGAIKESLQRIEHALQSHGFRMPRQRIVINLQPASLRKTGSAFDLAIALGILAASKQLNEALLSGMLFLGELSLSGDILPVNGALSAVLMAQKMGFSSVVLPNANILETHLVAGMQFFPVNSIGQVVDLLEGKVTKPYVAPSSEDITVQMPDKEGELDFSDVKGQHLVKRALEVAAAGGHNVLLVGPPGAGKSMLARLIPTILPPLDLHEALETTQVYSVGGRLPQDQTVIRRRPFRAPHHTITTAALVGGGAHPRPGEVSYAHHGVLFLDELPEFKRSVLEVLRQPLEDHRLCLDRAHIRVRFPADFMLIAAMNPCPCGYFNHPSRPCACGALEIHRYRGRISGPLLDRIDLHVEVLPVDYQELSLTTRADSSKQIRERVLCARKLQAQRFESYQTSKLNARMTDKQVVAYCKVDVQGQALLRNAMEQLHLSARAYVRILKLARTIADLEANTAIRSSHIAEAIQFRSMDRELIHR